MTCAIETPELAALAALLAYPSEELRGDLDDVAALLDDAPFASRTRAALRALVQELRSHDLYELQERYVELFDRSRQLSLNLFEHVHGESRDRGQAMVDLAALYERAGLEISARELPDYLPLFLEYAATRLRAEALELLGETGSVVATLAARLNARGSVYASVFVALCELAAAPSVALDEAHEEGHDLESLDAEWNDEAVEFGAGAAHDACGLDRLRTRVRAERRDARNLSGRGEANV